MEARDQGWIRLEEQAKEHARIAKYACEFEKQDEWLGVARLFHELSYPDFEERTMRAE